MSGEPSSSERFRTPASRSRPRRWPGWVGLAVLIALPVLSVLTVLVWVYGGTTERGAVATVEREMGHVHGLGFNTADDAIYVATHSGVFRIVEGAPPSRVADRHQDTMGFTVAGPATFLGSGHPDFREQRPPLLGLVELYFLIGGLLKRLVYLSIGLAVVATSLTIVAVFVPVSFMPGIPGQYFRQFGLTVAIGAVLLVIGIWLLTEATGIL